MLYCRKSRFCNIPYMIPFEEFVTAIEKYKRRKELEAAAAPQQGGRPRPDKPAPPASVRVFLSLFTARGRTAIVTKMILRRESRCLFAGASWFVPLAMWSGCLASTGPTPSASPSAPPRPELICQRQGAERIETANFRGGKEPDVVKVFHKNPDGSPPLYMSCKEVDLNGDGRKDMLVYLDKFIASSARSLITTKTASPIRKAITKPACLCAMNSTAIPTGKSI